MQEKDLDVLANIIEFEEVENHPNVFRVVNGKGETFYIKYSSSAYIDITICRLYPTDQLPTELYEEFLSTLLFKNLIPSLVQKFDIPFQIKTLEFNFISFKDVWVLYFQHSRAPKRLHKDQHLALISKGITAPPLQVHHLQGEYQQYFSLIVGVLHMLGAQDVKPEHFLFDPKAQVLYIIDCSFSTETTEDTLKQKKILESIKNKENLIDHPEYDNSPEDLKAAFKALPIAKLDLIIQWLFPTLLNNEFINSLLLHLPYSISQSEIEQFYEKIVHSLLQLTKKMISEDILSQKMLKPLSSSTMPRYPCANEAAQPSSRFIFWKKNIDHLVTHLELRADPETIYIITYYQHGALGDVTGAINIFNWLKKLGVPALLLISAAEKTKYLENYLKKNNVEEAQVFQGGVFDANIISLFLKAPQGSADFIIFEHINENLLLNYLIPNARSILFVSSYNKGEENEEREKQYSLLTSYEESSSVKVTIIRSGIGKDRAGIFPPLVEPDSTAIEKIQDILNQFPKTGLLFGGYVNKMENFQLIKNINPLKNYFLSCLILAKMQNSNRVNFILNVEEVQIDIHLFNLTNTKKKENTIRLSLTEEELRLYGVTQLTLINKQGRLSITNTIDIEPDPNQQNGIHLRILNPFPLSTLQFRTLLQHIKRQPYPSFLTTVGTLSILDVIQEELIPVPQIMKWERGFWNAYVTYFEAYPELKEYLGLFDGTVQCIEDFPKRIAEFIYNKSNQDGFQTVHKKIKSTTPSLLDSITKYVTQTLPGIRSSFEEEEWIKMIKL